MGLDCRMNSWPPSIAHSTSWGAPKYDSILRPILATMVISSVVSDGAICLSSVILTEREPSAERKMPVTLRFTVRSISLPVSLSQMWRSGVTSPEAMDSPRPQEDSIMMRSFLPETGSEVNMIPEERASTMRWTTTAMPLLI
ncbi:MAG: hypothetical protein A4E31_00315 [Methanomassiliicoccales archaeon PtaU1.Bin030]|nr:MAG: hypothetical protein A4E31_00315 [Methanomassiliicoccales archaeon PtaU1.Bin030]